MTAERFPEIAQLPDENKLTLMAELWQDVTDDVADESPALAAFVEERWQEYLQHPERVSPWSQVKARILTSRACSASWYERNLPWCLHRRSLYKTQA